MKDIIDGTPETCCATCFWYNGIIGDGYQFCDTREIEVKDTDYCWRYKFLDKSEMISEQ